MKLVEEEAEEVTDADSDSIGNTTSACNISIWGITSYTHARGAHVYGMPRFTQVVRRIGMDSISSTCAVLMRWDMCIVHITCMCVHIPLVQTSVDKHILFLSFAWPDIKQPSEADFKRPPLESFPQPSWYVKIISKDAS